MANIHPGRIVAVFGCGPVGQFVIASLKLMKAGRIFAIDTIPSRLEMAQEQGAEIIDFNQEDPIDALRRLTGGIGPDRVIDAVGVDAVAPKRGPAERSIKLLKRELKEELEKIAPKTRPRNGNWHPGDAPSLVLNWAVQAVAKAGTLSIVGVYPDTVQNFPIGKAMNRNLTLRMGNCNHRKYIPMLVDLVRAGVVDPTEILTQAEPITDAIDAYKQFDQRRPGWIKVMLEPARMPSRAA
jgi:threonine dehydrogenase-like Zn-dependent dehydrogenase